MHRSIALKTPSPSPERKNRLPMIRNSGIGVSAYIDTASPKLVTIWPTPTGPPMNRYRQTMLVAKKAKATGTPTPISVRIMPIITASAIGQVMV